jgi:hypothetical protein
MGLVARKVKPTRLVRGVVVVGAEAVVAVVGVAAAAAVAVGHAGMAWRASAKTASSRTLTEPGKMTRLRPHKQVVAVGAKEWVMLRMTGQNLKLSVMLTVQLAFVWERPGCG